MRSPAFPELSGVDLYVDAIYRGGRSGNSSDDPFSPLLRVSNSGGFRYRGNLDQLKMVVLTSTLADLDWPDELDKETGVYTYYGDNKKPGRGLHETPRKGNELLRRVFEDAHGGRDSRLRVPPVFVFANTGEWRDAVFLGLAVPGTSDLRASEDLVAIWRVASGRRFQNYRARFTIVDAPIIPRAWINDIVAGETHTLNTPAVWRRWIETGRPQPLLASRSLEYRTPSEQLPSDEDGLAIIRALHGFFVDRPHAFERCAAQLARLMLPDIASLDLTRPSRDGGRDAVGQLRIGVGPASILVDFALEAKCYDLSNSVGVRETSRLISRLRHRQFGILVTSSYVNTQAYKEIKEDKHPIIVISSSDIVSLLRQNGRGDISSVVDWLSYEFLREIS